jgi:mutator protein MutT
MTHVAAGILERNGCVLICQRRHDQPHPGKWEFPGGKVEQGESPEDALVRELREELGIESAEPVEISRYEFTYPGKTPILLVFLKVSAWTGEIENRIFKTIVWESHDKLKDYDFLEGDLPFIAAHKMALRAVNEDAERQ